MAKNGREPKVEDPKARCSGHGRFRNGLFPGAADFQGPVRVSGLEILGCFALFGETHVQTLRYH